ncbi:MAG: DUF5652 family protein [Chloroflexota bacterium]
MFTIINFERLFGLYGFLLVAAVILAVIWSSIWKGIALWRASRNHHLVWFIVMLVVNTLGILEIVYIFGFSQKGRQGQ